jgi:hypothetical protein
MRYEDLDKYNSVKTLREFTEKLLTTTAALQLELQQTKDKLTHLEQIAKHSVSAISVGANEEELCKLEINRLYQAAQRGPLEFNEVKAFEIYVKSLMLIRNKGNVEEKSKPKKGSSLTEEQLIQLALQVQVVDESNEQ